MTFTKIQPYKNSYPFYTTCASEGRKDTMFLYANVRLGRCTLTLVMSKAKCFL